MYYPQNSNQEKKAATGTSIEKGKTRMPSVSGQRAHIKDDTRRECEKLCAEEQYSLDPMDFGIRLQNLRISHGFTQEMFAEMLGVSREFYSRIEQGRKMCSINILINVSLYLGVSTDYLLFGKENDKTNRNQILHIISELTEIAQNM